METPARIEGASMTGAAPWIEELQWLTVRFSCYGIGPDFAGLTLAQAWGVLLFLRRMAGGANA